MKSLALASILFCCTLLATAQLGGSNQQSPPSSTPSTFPQDQTGQTPSNPTHPSGPSAIPPDTSATGESPASASAQTAVTGCLNRGADGNFTLADNSGATYQLRGNQAELAALVGNQVKVEGSSTAAAKAGAMAQPSDASGNAAASERWLSVDHVTKISDQCASTMNK
jgi:hypothetical protein